MRTYRHVSMSQNLSHTCSHQTKALIDAKTDVGYTGSLQRFPIQRTRDRREAARPLQFARSLPATWICFQISVQTATTEFEIESSQDPSRATCTRDRGTS